MRHAPKPSRPAIAALTTEALIASAFVAAWLGDGRSGEFLHRAEEIAGSDDRHPTPIEPSWSMAVLLQEPDDIDAARRVLRSLVDGAVARGDEFSTIEILAELADAEWRAGNWAAALANLSDMQRLAPGSIGLISNRALVEACMGDVDDAVTDGEGALAKAESAGLVSARIEALHALGHVRLSLGDAASANVHLARAWEIFRRAGFGDPGTFPFVPDHVEALVEIGAVADAEPIVDWLEERGRTLERAYAQATGARCRALLRAAGGDLDGGLTSLDEAVKYHERLTMPFELGRRSWSRVACVAAPVRNGPPGRRSSRRSGSSRCSVPGSGRRRPGRSSPGSEDVERPRRADGSRTAGGETRRGRSHQPGDRRHLVHERPDRRGPPLAHLPQARHPVSHGARPLHR